MPEYIVFWKDAPGQLVSTVVDAKNELVKRDDDYVRTNHITVLDDEEEIVMVLAAADGEKYAVTSDKARHVLGWDVH